MTYLPDGTGENQEKTQDSVPGRHLKSYLLGYEAGGEFFPFYTQGVEISFLIDIPGG